MNAKIAHAVAALAATAFLSNAAAVHATVITPDEEFTFTGQCTDCTGTGIGVLTLSGYTQGNGLALSNFVSFTYKSNLLNLSYDVATYIRGNLVNLPGKDYVVMVFNVASHFTPSTRVPVPGALATTASKTWGRVHYGL
jgi:hypothetical protein